MTTASTAAAATTRSQAAGDDTVAAHGIHGGRGKDVLAGGDGNDRIRGGRGTDKVDAGAGDDKVNVRDHAADTVDCGAGDDRVIADKADTLTGCEVQKVRGGGHGTKPKRPGHGTDHGEGSHAPVAAAHGARRLRGRRAAFPLASFTPPPVDADPRRPHDPRSLRPKVSFPLQKGG